MYHSVVLGGTFDRLHRGHQTLLGKAFAVGKKVTIGLTTDEYIYIIKDLRPRRISPGLKKSFRKVEPISSYSVRKHALVRWLTGQGWAGRYEILPLNERYGQTTKKSSDFDVIVVSVETRKTADIINDLRKEEGLPPLSVVEIPMVPAHDLQRISSTRIRNGEIDRRGKLTLPDSLRMELRKAIGEVIPQKDIPTVCVADRNNILTTVGDMTTKKFLELGIKPALSILDFQMERKPFLWEKDLYTLLLETSTVRSLKSGPGYISREAIAVIRDTFQGLTKGVYRKDAHTVILVDGEEDLLVLPVIIHAPQGSILYYGQPGKGLVRVEITDAKKHRAGILLKKFIVE